MKTIVNQLNELAEKITGTNPKATTDKKALDFIADYYANKDLTPITNAQAIQNITENFSAGGIDTSDATATESDIVKDKTAYAKGEKITGTFVSTPLHTQIRNFYDSCNATIYYIVLNEEVTNQDIISLLGEIPYMSEKPPVFVNVLAGVTYLLCLMQYYDDNYYLTDVNTGSLRICTYDENTNIFSEITQ